MTTHAANVLARLAQAGVRPRAITADSRQVGAGDVFAAWPGAARDGRRYIGEAISRGAAAVLFEAGDGFQPPESGGRPLIAVDGLRALAGHLAHEIHGRPSEKLWLAGVTGTNGKTSVSQWLAKALETFDVRCGVIGTLGNGFPDALAAGVNTTPDALELHRLLAGFAADGACAAAMEVSSIGLDQGRVNGARFNVAIFTNLTRDHLDYHGSIQAYAKAKARLFDSPGLDVAVINLDDDFGLGEARRLTARGVNVTGYATAAGRAAPGARMLLGERARASAGGLCFDLSWEGQRAELEVRLAGMFNVSNLLAVIGALLARGVELDDALRAAKTLAPPPGRMQLVGGEGEPLVIVDYAHTPDALAKALEAGRDSARARGGHLICVFGCGGERDAGKRPLMGEAASRLADRVIVTSDNPRGEPPQKIIDAILAGAGAAAEAVPGRAEAIRAAVDGADARDVIVLAGKGHEPYQEILGERRPFSDCDQAARALAARRGRVAA
ncbi:MAG: UDP-N-acetylmuramoyl-L-alanyl-D-glutamate--2,6-diaminopimelate ligase [Azoarcus sp.]|jgi:UDP-N-acetylmuramoyl-L-alanyl-D-glutamate--2,6-diaminopimelate ligase|nr:UDP-N-acetylmuramoyl-L-alanyl-D-glutamate--2,6-diaminopimelate ligase [Azoarcus sp.]